MIRFISALFLLIVLAGCNTIEGVGKDIEQAGEAVQDSTK